VDDRGLGVLHKEMHEARLDARRGGPFEMLQLLVTAGEVEDDFSPLPGARSIVDIPAVMLPGMPAR